jgi:hypothetical protein
VLTLTVTAAPTLTNLPPSSASVATAITISGSTFGVGKGSSTVTFNGTAATPTSWSASSMGFPTLAGATTGNVVVMVGGLANNALTYTATLLPTPTSGPVATAVTITGSNFGATKPSEIPYNLRGARVTHFRPSARRARSSALSANVWAFSQSSRSICR